MKNKELIEILSKLNSDAEVGYECQSIARAHADISGEYIDLSGERRIEKEKIGDTGVFIVLSKYHQKAGVWAVDDEGKMARTTEESDGTEINAVYSTREQAEKMGKWLIKCGEIDGRIYTEYTIENFLIL